MSDSNKARVKNASWASDDDASNLLADILNDTAHDAAAEQQRIQAELKAREDEERRAREAEERKKQEEAQARLNAESSRQNQVQERRTQKLEALKIEELKERGEWVDPAIEQARLKAEEERQRQAAMQAAIQQQHQQQQQAAQQAAQAAQQAPTPEAHKKPASKGSIIALVSVLVLVLAAGGVIAALTLGSYKPDPTSYAKVTLAPKDATDTLTTAAFAPLPKSEVAVADTSADDDDKSSKSSKRSKRSKSSRGDSGKKPAEKGKKEIKKLNLGDDDIFGGGF